jgi:Response regulators consisting of a CheY-like receiver domain and a winged-helix DNA-binding domain
VLVVEDEAKTRASLVEGLGLQGWETVAATNGVEAETLLAERDFDLVVLDWMLPGRSGLQLLGQLRSEGRHIPVLMLTARTGIDDRVAGLERGADDYLAKPFAFAELVARCRALLRRATTLAPALTCEDLQLDVRARLARRGEREIPLTPREVDVLEYLLRHQGQIVTREMLQHDVWKQPKRFTSLDNVIDVQMARLRRKIDEGDGEKLIHTLRGLGYRLGKESA